MGDINREALERAVAVLVKHKEIFLPEGEFRPEEIAQEMLEAAGVGQGATPLRCQLGWHKMSPWSKSRPGEYTRLHFMSGMTSKVSVPVQGRRCLLCGREELREAN